MRPHAPVPYDEGMSGNQVKAEVAAAGADDWAMQRKMNHRRMIEAAEARLMTETIAEGDAAAADRHVRAITNLARAVVAVEAIKPSRAGRAEDQQEDEMGGRQDDDPRELEALRAELLERYDFFAAEREVRGRAEADGRRGAEDAPRPEPEAGETPEGTGDGLADLADAGWPRGGQDLRGGLLAA